MTYGYVYCLINDCMPNLCKIGYTNRINKTSHDRAKELSNSTSCPTEFKVVFDIKVKNPLKYEKILHKKLHNLRYNDKREFFKCTPIEIVDFFKLDNLIECETNKTDFYYKYFNQYLNLIPPDKCPEDLNIPILNMHNEPTNERIEESTNESANITLESSPNINKINWIKENGIYKCIECTLEFKTNSGLWKHNKIKHNILYDNFINTNLILKYICKYCNKPFSDRIARWRHERDYCKFKTEQNIDSSIINNQTNINFIKLGNEDLSFITQKDIELITNQTEPIKYTIIKILELINFNENLPQNHTFCTTSLNNKYVSTLNIDTLNIEKHRKSDYFDKILLYGLSHLKTLNNMIKSRAKKKQFNDIILEIEKYLFTNSDYKKIYIDLINVLSYNKRNLIDATWKKIINESFNNNLID